MKPIITLVGRPNVGKSTLFNQITRTRHAIVSDFSSLTRDRNYGLAKWQGYEFIVIDTAGIEETNDKIKKLMIHQTILAIQEADIILFVVDGKVGLMSSDLIVAKYLRLSQKKILIVANKIDNIDIHKIKNEFKTLGMGEIIPIIASQGRGINYLIQQILFNILEKKRYDFTDKVEKKEIFNIQNLPIKLAIVGRPNVGKSTLINSFLGEERVITFDTPGTTRDSLYINMYRNGKQYILIDTAGVKKRMQIKQIIEKFSIVKTLKSIEETNVVILVINADQKIFDQDLSLLNFIINSGKALVIAINKWDNLSKEERNKIKVLIKLRFSFINFARIHFISALYQKGLNNLLKSVDEAYECTNKRINTSILTNIMRKAVNKYQPTIVQGRRIKLKYAHIGGYNPPIIVIHGTKLRYLSNSYKNYLINYFRHSLKIIGTPIIFRFKESFNPFII